MPRGVYDRKKLVPEPTDELKGREAAAMEIAEVLQSRCGIPGCVAKFHLEEAQILLRKFINLGIIKDVD
jgi:hypothetical protein